MTILSSVRVVDLHPCASLIFPMQLLFLFLTIAIGLWTHGVPVEHSTPLRKYMRYVRTIAMCSFPVINNFPVHSYSSFSKLLYAVSLVKKLQTTLHWLHDSNACTIYWTVERPRRLFCFLGCPSRVCSRSCSRPRKCTTLSHTPLTLG